MARTEEQATIRPTELSPVERLGGQHYTEPYTAAALRRLHNTRGTTAHLILTIED